MYNSNFTYCIDEVYLEPISNALALLELDEFKGNVWDKKYLEGLLSSSDIILLGRMKLEIKKLLYDACNGRCNYCHIFEERHENFLLDHFIVKKKATGFGNYAYYCTNLVLSCWPCNNKKGQKLFLRDNPLADLQALEYEYLPFSVFHPNVHSHEEHFHRNSESLSVFTDEAYNFLEEFEFLNDTRMRQMLQCLDERGLSTEDQNILFEISGTHRTRKF